jgi:phosphatidylinositol alpha 1,6-mannosyltransferase
MRVIHFLGTMRPGHDGVTQVAYRMREGFQRSRGEEHFFVSPLTPDPIPLDMLKVPSVPMLLSTNYRLSTFRTRSVKTLLKEKKPDLIHIHSPCTLGHAAVKAAHSMGIPIVATYHTHFPTYLKYYKVDFLKSFVWNRLKKHYRFCEAIIVPSKSTLQDLHQQGISNLIHIPHGVDTRRFSPQHRSHTWRQSVKGEGKTIVTFVSRLVWEKNLKVLAEAYEQLQTQQQVRLVVVGDGPARQKLAQMLPHAHFTGKLGSSDIATAYASSDIFAFPSITETFGNVTVEAMASGLPAVCASAGGACDIVKPGVNGLLTRPNDSMEFAKAIDFLVTHPETRAQFAHEALNSVSQYQWENSIRRYEEIYERVKKSALKSSESQPYQLNPAVELN